MLKIVSDDLFTYLLDRVSGTRFESFAKQIFAIHFSESFAPLGGVHDGGADGAISSYVQEVQGKVNTFAQFTTTSEGKVKIKIAETIDSLRRAGRDPRQLIYATSRALPKSDLISQEIFESHNVLVQIRDVERIKGYVNSEAAANAAFRSAFDSEITALSKAANLNLTSVTEFAKDPTVYVFLNHELRDRFARDHLNDRVLDSLIYWTLRETDPDKNILLTRQEVSAAIAAAFPPARAVLLPRLNDRLTALSKKDPEGMERLRYYRASDSFSLPFDMRQTLAAEASSVVLHQEAFRDSIAQRLIDESSPSLTEQKRAVCNELVFSTIHRYFIEQGLLLAAFLEKRLEDLKISDQVVEDTMAKALAEIEHGSSVSPEMFGVCLAALRGVFYKTTAVEREYLTYLSRTSCILVTLQSAPKLIEYMNQLGGNFRLLVGADLLVKSISERYLDGEHQQVTNLLSVCRQLGSELVLTEPALNEVFTHLHAADLEFRNHYAQQEPFLKPTDVSECDRIMIRAYLYARNTLGGPTSWRNFIDQLTDPEGLRNKSEGARQALCGLLVQRYGLKYMPLDDVEKAVSKPHVQELATRLDESRSVKRPELSYNDALHVYATYALRRKAQEVGKYDGFGFRTWWLTKETRVLGLTGSIVHAEGGVPYIMRPEFILNFVALAPKAAEVRKAFASLLPTTAGLQLGQHLQPEVMRSLMSDVSDWATHTPERVSMMISDKVNRLKYDRYKQYTQQLR